MFLFATDRISSMNLLLLPPCVLKDKKNIAKILEGPEPDWKYFGQSHSGNGSSGTTDGLPRFRDTVFLARFPFCPISLSDPDIPLATEITGWSPFIPGDADHSRLPAGVLEYRFKNPTGQIIESVFSFNTTNFIAITEKHWWGHATGRKRYHIIHARWFHFAPGRE